jgi:hypothetical protein
MSFVRSFSLIILYIYLSEYILKIVFLQMKINVWAGGVGQVVECLLVHGPEFKFQHHQNKTKGKIKDFTVSRAPVAHGYNPSYLGG